MPTKTKSSATITAPADREARPLQFSPPPFWPAQLSIKHTAEYLDYSVPRVWQLISAKELEVVGPPGTKRWITMASIECYRAKLKEQAADGVEA